MKRSNSPSHPTWSLIWPFLVALAFALAGPAHSASVTSLTQPTGKKSIGDTSKFPVPVKPAGNAVLIIVNGRAFEVSGVDLPKDPHDPAFTKELERIVHVIAAEQDPSSDTYDATLYGGEGVGTYYGDGRTAKKGEIQVKYIGATGLSGTMETSSIIMERGRSREDLANINGVKSDRIFRTAHIVSTPFRIAER